MTPARGLYLVTAVIAAFGLGLSAVAYRVINGAWQSPGQLLPMFALYVAMALFIPYRRSRGLSLTPPWLMIGVGAVGIAVYALWLTSDSRPGTIPEWIGFLLIAAVPVGLLVTGLRNSRQQVK